MADATSRTLRVQTPAQQVALLVGLALVVFLVSLPLITLRPDGVDWAIWWPAAGLAVGICLWTPRRWLVPAIILIALALIAAQAVAGRELALAVVLGLAATAEVGAAHQVLRGRHESLPQLVRLSDLATLTAAALLGALALSVVGGSGIALLYGPADAVDFIRVSALAHFVGVLAVAPYFFEYGRSSLTGRAAELIAQWVSLFGVLAVASAAAIAGIPIAFALLGPLVWGAARFGGRLFLLQYLIAMTLVAQVTIGGRNLIAVEGLPPQTSALMVQLFLVSSTVVIISVLALATSNRRLLRLSESAIAASLTAFAMLRRDDRGWHLEARNDSARIILGEGPVDLRQVFVPDSVQWLQGVSARVSNAADTMGGVERLVTTSGRVLQATLSPLIDVSLDRRGDNDRRYSLQFTDITDSLQIAEAQEVERRRAGEVQRALLPSEPPRVPGWDIAAACHPSREVGGDFYSWSLEHDELTISLGDVMGKGLGAGVMAASVQMAVSLHEAHVDPGVAVGHVAAAVQHDMERAATFATLFLARISIEDGKVRYADAGHGLAVIVSAQGATRRVTGDGLPLGIMLDSHWNTELDRLEPGETLVVVSDGVLDAFEAGQDALDEVSHLAPASSTAQEFVARIVALADRPTVVDDVTVVVVRRL